MQLKLTRKLQPHKDDYGDFLTPLDTIYRFALFAIFQGDSGEEAAIGSIEGVNGNRSDAKGEKVRSFLLLRKT